MNFMVEADSSNRTVEDYEVTPFEARNAVSRWTFVHYGCSSENPAHAIVSLLWGIKRNPVPIAYFFGVYTNLGKRKESFEPDGRFTIISLDPKDFEKHYTSVFNLMR